MGVEGFVVENGGMKTSQNCANLWQFYGGNLWMKGFWGPIWPYFQVQIRPLQLCPLWWTIGFWYFAADSSSAWFWLIFCHPFLKTTLDQAHLSFFVSISLCNLSNSSRIPFIYQSEVHEGPTWCIKFHHVPPVFQPYFLVVFHKAVLMEITIKHVFAINPAAANFTCEFEVNMAWLDAKAKQMPSGTKLDKEKCHVLVPYGIITGL